MYDETIEVYEKEAMSEFIKKIKNIDFDKIVKSEHFLYSVDEKNTDVEELRENFGEFEKIKIVQKRKHKNGNISYDFYYELEDKTYLIYSIGFEEKPILINGFHVKRNFEHFKKALMKAYKDRLVSN